MILIKVSSHLTFMKAGTNGASKFDFDLQCVKLILILRVKCYFVKAMSKVFFLCQSSCRPYSLSHSRAELDLRKPSAHKTPCHVQC